MSSCFYGLQSRVEAASLTAPHVPLKPKQKTGEEFGNNQALGSMLKMESTSRLATIRVLSGVFWKGSPTNRARLNILTEGNGRDHRLLSGLRRSIGVWRAKKVTVNA
jgi:hypothetical protein